MLICQEQRDAEARVLLAYARFLDACRITDKQRNRAYAIGVLSGRLQGERAYLQRLIDYPTTYRIGWGEEIGIRHAIDRVDETLAACSKLYINNEV